MEVKDLKASFKDTLEEDIVDCIGEIAERGLDDIMNEGLLKEIPLISTVIAIYKIGHSIRDRHNVKKLAVFLNEINKNIDSKQKREEYKYYFQIS